MDINEMYRDMCYTDREIRDKAEKIAELLTLATNTTMPLSQDKVYTIGGNKDRIGTIMDKVIDLEAEIAVLRTHKRLKQVKTIISLSMVESNKRKQIAVDKYIRNRSLNQIAKNRNITQNGVCKSLRDTRIELCGKDFCKNEK